MSYVERQILTMHMEMSRFTRFTNAFSKKIENHLHMLSLYFLHYNFCRMHGSLRCTPAMAAGLKVKARHFRISTPPDSIERLCFPGFLKRFAYGNNPEAKRCFDV